MTDRGGPDDRERLGRDPAHGSGDRGGGGLDRDMDREGANRGFESGRTDTGHGGVREENPRRGRGWGIAALILGILALLGSLFGVLNFVFALPGLILGIVALRKGARGFGIAAIILSVLAIAIGVLLTVLAGAAIMNSPEFQQILQEAE
jgi:hypothetical protein